MFSALFSNAIFNKLISVPAYGDEVFRKAFLVNIVRNVTRHAKRDELGDLWRNLVLCIRG